MTVKHAMYIKKSSWIVRGSRSSREGIQSLRLSYGWRGIGHLSFRSSPGLVEDQNDTDLPKLGIIDFLERLGCRGYRIRDNYYRNSASRQH